MVLNVLRKATLNVLNSPNTLVNGQSALPTTIRIPTRGQKASPKLVTGKRATNLSKTQFQRFQERQKNKM